MDRDPKIVQQAITRTASKAGLPTAEHDLHPRTRLTPAEKLEVGDVLMQSAGHPVRIVQIRRPGGRVALRVLYIWSTDAEIAWPLGPFAPGQLVAKAVKRRGTR